MQLTIDKGIPVPETTVRHGSNIALLKSMSVGDSIFFDAAIMKKATRFYRVAKRLGLRIVVRKYGAGVRLWRLEDGKDAPVERPIDPATRHAIQQRVRKINKTVKKTVKDAAKVKAAKNKKDRERRAKKKLLKVVATTGQPVPDFGSNIQGDDPPHPLYD